MKKINVLQLITGLGMGGAEKVVLDLSKYLSKEYFDVYVVGMSKKDDLYQEFINNNIQTTILRKSNSLIDFCLIIYLLNKIIKDKDIQIIHAHMAHSVIIASILRIINPKIKIVFTSHNLNIGSKVRERIIWLMKPLRNIDIIFSKEILKYFYNSNYKVIPNGIKIEKYNLNIPKNNKFTFIAVGRLETVKNHKILLEIANEFKEKFNFEIQIVGQGYLKDELEKLIKLYGLEEYVKLLGLRNDIPNLLNKAHCLLMPSLWEGLPIVILEAGASNLPIISTPVGSIPSVLNDENSYLCNLESFKDNMICVLENYQSAKTKSIKLFNDIIKSYSIESIVCEHEKVYKKLI